MFTTARMLWLTLPLVTLLAACAGARGPTGTNLSPLHVVQIGRDMQPNAKGITLYVADSAAEHVVAFSVTGTRVKVVRTITQDLSQPLGLAVDLSGNLFVADSGQARIFAYEGGGTSETCYYAGHYGDGIGAVWGVAVDTHEKVHASNNSSPQVDYWTGSFCNVGNAISISGSFKQVSGMSVDESNDAFVADVLENQIFEIPYGSSKIIPLNLDDIKKPYGVAFDTRNHLYVVNNGNATITEYKLPSKKPIRTIAGGMQNPQGITLSAAGGIYVADLKVGKCGRNRGGIVIYKSGKPANPICSSTIVSPVAVAVSPAVRP